LLLLTFLEFSRIAKSEFSDTVKEVEIYDDRLKLYLRRGAVLEVRYPTDKKSAPGEAAIMCRRRRV